MKKHPNKIAIVGGGIAGLSAAYYLHQKNPNADFTLFEKNTHLGGNIQTKLHDGFLIETGPDAFLHKPIMHEIIKGLELEDQVIQTNAQNRKLYLLQNGKLRTVPKGFYLMGPSKKLPFLLSPALSWSTKIRTLLEPWVPQKKAIDDESLADFVTRRFGKGNLEEITQTMMGGIYTADPKTLSLQSTLPQFIHYEKKYGSVLKGLHQERTAKSANGPRYNQFRSFAGGMQTLIDAMELSLPPVCVKKNTLVQSIDYDNGIWNLRINGHISSFDYLIMAVPSRAIAHLSNFLDTPSKRILKSVEFSSCAIAHFGYEKNQILQNIDAMGLLVPQKEKRAILASTFCSQKFGDRAEHDRVLIRTFLGGALNQDILGETDGALLHAAKKDLQDLLKIKGEPILQKLIRWPDAMPQYKVGHQKAMSSFFEKTRNFENLCFLGNTYDGVGIPHLIEKSKTAVDGIL